MRWEKWRVEQNWTDLGLIIKSKFEFKTTTGENWGSIIQAMTKWKSTESMVSYFVKKSHMTLVIFFCQVTIISLIWKNI